MAKHTKKEQRLQTLVSKYMHLKYPKKHFVFDVAAGLHFKSQGIKRLVAMWRSEDKLPDGYLFVARGKWHTLMLELKTIEACPFKIDGTLKSNEHVEGQAARHEELKADGMCATFAVGIDNALEIIEWYMDGAEGEIPMYKPVSKKGDLFSVYKSANNAKRRK